MSCLFCGTQKKIKESIIIFSYKKANGIQYSFTPHWHSLNGQKLWKKVFSNMDTWLNLPFISNPSFFLHTFYVNHFLLARTLRQNPEKMRNGGDKMTKMLWFHNFILHVHLQRALNTSVTRERFQWHICMEASSFLNQFQLFNLESCLKNVNYSENDA